jgi:hypothetical protein
MIFSWTNSPSKDKTSTKIRALVNQLYQKLETVTVPFPNSTLVYVASRKCFELTIKKCNLNERDLINVVCSLLETIKQINDEQYSSLNLHIVNNDTNSDVFFKKMKCYFMNTSSADALFFNDQYTEDKQGYVISIEIAKRNMEKFNRKDLETFISRTNIGALLTDIEDLLDRITPLLLH